MGSQKGSKSMDLGPKWTDLRSYLEVPEDLWTQDMRYDHIPLDLVTGVICRYAQRAIIGHIDPIY
jgi:hypothetical protein